MRSLRSKGFSYSKQSSNQRRTLTSSVGEDLKDPGRRLRNSFARRHFARRRWAQVILTWERIRFLLSTSHFYLNIRGYVQYHVAGTQSSLVDSSIFALAAAGFLSFPPLFHDPAGVIHEGEAVGTMARADIEVSWVASITLNHERKKSRMNDSSYAFLAVHRFAHTFRSNLILLQTKM
jgi:hypothetical protein